MPTLGSPIPVGVTNDEKNALKGTSGTPSDSNRFVTNGDSRVTLSTSTPSSIDPDDAGAVGTGTQPAREDHQHAVTCAAPSQGIGGSNAEGSAGTFARSDHDHLIRETDGPTNLSVGDIPDNYSVIRSGTSLVGVNPYNPDRTVVVAKTALGADATNIADAITKANALSPAPSASAPAAIVVHPGIYSTPPFTLPAYVNLVGVGGAEAVVLDASTATAALCTASGGQRVQGLTLQGADGVGGIGVSNGGAVAGVLVIEGCRIVECTLGINCDGANRVVDVRRTHVQNGTNGLYVNGSGAFAVISHLNLVDLTTGADIGTSGGTIKGTDLHCFDDAGFTLHVRVQAAASELELMNSTFRADKVDFHPSAVIQAAIGSDVPGDAAFKIFGEFHVGRETDPHESAFGGGDSHVRNMVCFTNTNGEAGTWNDITSTLSVADASSAPLFAGVGAANCFYVGAPYAFPGIKAAITTARSGGTVVLEYWNGAAWTVISHLSSDANAPYAQYAQRVFLRVNSEQIRFGNQPSWATKTLNGVSRYWVRYRITSALTTSPAADQIKIYPPGRTEINADGVVEYFGAAEPQRLMLWHRKMTEELDGFVPQDADVAVASGLTIKALRNRWQQGNKDGTVSFLTPLAGLDTSRPIIFEAGWFKEVAGSGNVELQLDVVTVNPGSVFNGALPYTQQLSQIVAVGAQAVGALIVTQFNILVPDLESTGSLVMSLYRDATGGNLDDTYEQNAVQVFSRVFGTFWR